MSEPYWDERSTDTGGGWGGSGGGGGDWGGSGGGGGGGDGGGSWGGESFSPAAAAARLNKTVSNFLLADKDGRLLSCKQNCVIIPALVAYVSGEGAGAHRRCMLCTTTDSKRPVSLRLVGGYDDKADTPAIAGHWPLGQPGTYQVRAKWQSGHYDHARVNSVRFVVYGVSCGWTVLPLNSWATVATIVIDKQWHITVNSTPGKRTGNQSILEGK